MPVKLYAFKQNCGLLETEDYFHVYDSASTGDSFNEMTTVRCASHSVFIVTSFTARSVLKHASKTAMG